MRNLTHKLLALGLTFGLASSAVAFSLMGPPASWQTATIGYDPLGTDVGGPMNLFEDYRLTVPVLNYGFDATFLNFFGSNGVAAIDAAMAILNNVPAASAMSSNLAEFPIQAVGPPNVTAANLRVFDLKSAALSTVLGQMGIASPERWTYALRDRTVIAGVTNYTVIQRNFDPINRRPTNVVNGNLYTYSVIEPILPGNYADAVETLQSGFAFNRSVASVDDGGGLAAGLFFTSLTRDDYGALRYLLRFNNVHTEDLQANLTLAPFRSPYSLPGGTNTSTNVPITLARRPGIDRVSFNPIPIDSLLNVTLRVVTNKYTDYYYHPTNGYLTNQVLERAVGVPDILFTAGDLGNTAAGALLTGAALTRPTSTRWTDNSALAGNSSGFGTGILAGPGVIPSTLDTNSSAIVIEFSTLGPSRLNISSAGARFLTERDAVNNGVWGFFDTTTIYSVFPDGVTIQDLERQLYGR
ncbi:MAG: hypothetical protein RL514_682 [Verrucomicrobiota bacterium]